MRDKKDRSTVQEIYYLLSGQWQELIYRLEIWDTHELMKNGNLWVSQISVIRCAAWIVAALKASSPFTEFTDIWWFR